MIIKNIDYPELLVEAIKNDKLVIFCGAGISMSEPTNLPSFNELSDKIAELTNQEKRNDESDEQYLGRVENLGHDVHSKVCDILNATQTQPNTNHETLIDFFKKDIRIVTTNYDIMLESALEKRIEKQEYIHIQHFHMVINLMELSIYMVMLIILQILCLQILILENLICIMEI